MDDTILLIWQYGCQKKRWDLRNAAGYHSGPQKRLFITKKRKIQFYIFKNFFCIIDAISAWLPVGILNFCFVSGGQTTQTTDFPRWDRYKKWFQVSPIRTSFGPFLTVLSDKHQFHTFSKNFSRGQISGTFKQDLSRFEMLVSVC